ncbi:MAG: alpha/beta hydrolase [Thermodesulfobacteriota bacterium]
MKENCQYHGRGGDFHYIDWGGRHQLAHFSHATGLCAAVYAPLVQHLTGNLHVLGMDDRGHGRTTAAADTARLKEWDIFARDMERFFDSFDAPFVAMGHSRGAVSSLRLAYRRPDLVKALVLIDPTILSKSAMGYIYLLKKTGLIRFIPIASRAAKRRDVWPDLATIHAAYRKKSMFRSWDPACLDGYLKDGTQGNGDEQIRLSCTPAWESRCFSVYPHDLWRFIPRIKQPILVVYGGRSDTFREQAAKQFKTALPRARFVCFEENSHFVPMEKPKDVAQVILDFITSL